MLQDFSAARNDDTVIDFGRVLTILRRGWWIMAGTAFLGALVSAIVVLQIEPTFYAKSQLLMGQSDRSDSTLGALIQDLNIDDDAIAGEIAIITSGELLAKVSERLDLASRPEFNTALRPPEPPPSLPVRIADGAVDALKGILGIAPPDQSGQAGSGSTDPISTAARIGREKLGTQADFVGEISANLSVRQVGTTNLVDVQYVSTDRLLAAAIPNALVDVYLDNQLDRKFNALQRVTTGLEARLGDMRERLEDSERAVIDYRTSILAEGFGGSELLAEQIGDLSRRLSQAAAEHAELNSDLAGIDALIEEKGLLAATGLFQSELLDGLRSEVVDLRQRRDRLLQRFGADTAQTIGTTEEIKRLETIISEETSRLREERAQRANLAAARVEALRSELRKLESRAIEQSQRQIRLTQLERQYEAEQTVYTTFLDKFTSTSETLGLQEGDAQIISYAEPPPSPIAPNKKLTVVLGTIGGLFAGMGLVFLQTLTANAIRNTTQLRGLTGGTVLAQPKALRFLVGRANPLTTAERHPLGPLSESVRSLRSHLMLSLPKGRGSIISIVSSQTNGGKTTTSILLARSIAQMGISCVLVEADLRRPSIARLLKLGNEPDIVDVLTGKVPLEMALQTDDVSATRVLTARSGLADPAGVLLSEAMSDLLTDLREKFRVVIIDSAPLAPVSDAAPMIQSSDQIVFMVPFGMRRQEVENGLESISKFDPPQMLTVLSMTPRSTQKKYGYYYTSY